MSDQINTSVIRLEGTQAERLAYPAQTGKNKKIIEWKEPDGSMFEQLSDGSWKQTSFGGAVGVSFGFKLSSYTGDRTVTTGGIAIAKATGTTHSMLRNYDNTNYFTYGWGETDAEAITNAASGPRVLAGEIVKPEDLRWPDNATHMGLVADTASITAYEGQGKF